MLNFTTKIKYSRNRVRKEFRFYSNLDLLPMVATEPEQNSNHAISLVLNGDGEIHDADDRKC